MSRRKCKNCGAQLKSGTYFCEYCESDWTPVPKIEPGKPIPTIPEAIPVYELPNTPSPLSRKSNAGRVVFFVVALFFCWPVAIVYMWTTLPWKTWTKIIVTILLVLPAIIVGVYGGIYESIYAIRSDLPKYSSEPLPIEERKDEKISASQVFKDLKKDDSRPLDVRKKAWAEKYVDMWVVWEGQIESIHILSDSGGSWIDMLIDKDAEYSIEIFFNPSQNGSLEKIKKGDYVRISGRLWGYYFIDNIIRLAEGMVLAQWQEDKQKE